MKTLSIIFLFSFFSISVFCQDILHFSISGKLSAGGNSELELSEVAYSSRDKNDFIASCKINADGSYRLNGKLNYAGEYFLSVKNKKGLLKFYLDTIPVNFFGSADSIKKLHMVGTKNAEITKKYDTDIGKINTKYDSLINTNYSNITGVKIDDIKQLTMAKKYSLIDSLSPGSMSKILKAANDYLYPALYNYNIRFIQDYPGSYPVIKAIEALIYNYSAYHKRVPGSLNRLNKRELQKRIDEIPNIIKSNIYFEKVAGMVYALDNWTVGMNFPEIELMNEYGKKISSSKLLSHTQYLLVDFWASWCGPCIEQSKDIVKIYSAYRRDNFEVFGITIDQDKKKWIDALGKEKYPWPQGYGYRDSVINNFGITSIPANFLVNNKGEIIKINIKPKELEEVIKKLKGINN